jgi:3-oxoacyl-(acyl-carrier-protein) synthase
VSLADLQALQSEIEDIRRTMGPIGGVLHCAGSIDTQTPAFIHKSAGTLAAVLEPKVSGLDNLIRCVEKEPLQFLVLFSSIAGSVPALGVGHSDYAMANSYMDYVAQARRRDLPIVSIQWSSWKETGFGEVKSGAFLGAGLLSVTNAEGLGVLDRIVAKRPGAVILPVTVDSKRWDVARLLCNPTRTVTDKEAAAPVVGPAAQAPVSAETVKTPPELLEQTSAWLRALASAQLKIDESILDIQTPLQEFGVDSIMLMQVLRPIGQAVGATLDPSLLFEHSSIERFAMWLVGAHGEALAKKFAGTGAEPAPQPEPIVATQPAPIAAVPPVASEELATMANADIAVVGLACRFAGAAGLKEYWQLLAEGRSAIGPVPASRGTVAEGRHAALLDNVADFDTKFFQIPDSDAAVIDPQALLVLEVGLHTLCHAGYPLQEMKGSSTGVYLGGRSQNLCDPADLALARNPIVAVGQNYLASNISRFFDLRGPSLVVDTACSSALAAMNLAAQALRSGEITAALVGGVSVLDPDRDLALFEHRGLLQKEPQFHIFDRRARGAIYGEGAGMALLKTVEQARKDGDTIYALIRGIAVNNDGRTVGPSAPNVQAQKDVMNAALNKSGLLPRDIDYIDVNGSGSEIPDLLELKAIEAVYRPASTAVCELGSMKPNIGHPLCAEGIASFIKVVLMLHHHEHVPFLSAEQPSAHYSFESSPFRFSRTKAPWDKGSVTAAINCFADGGTNAHVILQTVAPSTDASRKPIEPPPLDRKDIRRFRQAQILAREPKVTVAASAPRGASGFWKKSAGIQSAHSSLRESATVGA